MSSETTTNYTCKQNEEEEDFKTYLDNAWTDNRVILFAKCCNCVTIKKGKKINGEHPEEQVQSLYKFLNLKKKPRLSTHQYFSLIKKKIEGQNILIETNHFKEQVKRNEKTLQTIHSTTKTDIEKLKSELYDARLDIITIFKEKEKLRNELSNEWYKNDKLEKQLKWTIKQRDSAREDLVRKEKELKLRMEGVEYELKKIPHNYQSGIKFVIKRDLSMII